MLRSCSTGVWQLVNFQNITISEFAIASCTPTQPPLRLALPTVSSARTSIYLLEWKVHCTGEGVSSISAHWYNLAHLVLLKLFSCFCFCSFYSSADITVAYGYAFCCSFTLRWIFIALGIAPAIQQWVDDDGGTWTAFQLNYRCARSGGVVKFRMNIPSYYY